MGPPEDEDGDGNGNDDGGGGGGGDDERGPRGGRPLLRDVEPPLGTGWGDTLLLENRLLWMGQQPFLAPLHYDANENLHVVLAGNKTFELYHPTQMGALYHSLETGMMRSHYLLYEFLEAEEEGEEDGDVKGKRRGKKKRKGRKKGRKKQKKRRRRAMDNRGLFHQIPAALSGPPSLQPFSPVNRSHPDYRAHPKFRAARRVTCAVGEGETIYLPAYWWHEVRSDPDPESGTVAAVTHFHRPYYSMASDFAHFSRTEWYRHLREDGSAERVAAAAMLAEEGATAHDEPRGEEEVVEEWVQAGWNSGDDDDAAAAEDVLLEDGEDDDYYDDDDGEDDDYDDGGAGVNDEYEDGVEVDAEGGFDWDFD